MIDRDFHHLNGLLSDFFSQKNIQQKLHIIHEHEITGWEIWLQIEFTNMLINTEHVFYREQALEFDYRQNKEKYYFRPDFLLLKKGWTQEKYMAVEFKQNPNPTTCVRNMAGDLKKVGQIRKSELDLRSVWAVGITEVIDNDRLCSLAEDYLDDKYYQTKRFNRHIQSYPIGNTPYCYIIM
ncbi:hypothetical protein [Pectobacterium sp. B1J-3]|uniref:hypothetical protein n=1 Tax=Pectobacterium sp. B1J-3 TaxID=3385371 RepID=UPI0039067341